MKFVISFKNVRSDQRVLFVLGYYSALFAYREINNHRKMHKAAQLLIQFV